MRASLDRSRAASSPTEHVEPDGGLLDFVVRAQPKYERPEHLAPLVEWLERSWTEEVNVTAHGPPRHGKTELVLAWIVKSLLLRPHETIAYVTYQADVARNKSRKIRQLAQEQGLLLAPDAQALGHWQTVQGGGLIATGIGGPLTSLGVNKLVVDDPYKNRIDAESAAYRSMVADWWSDVAETRVEPGGSRLVFHTRWTNNDLIGHIHEQEGAAERWHHVHMPAVSDAGAPLWPSRWPLEALRKKEKAVGPYTWASLYQGRPRPRGEQVFSGDVRFYDSLPDRGYRIGAGADLAYTSKKYSDYSVLVVLLEHADLFYVVDVLRLQVKAPAFAARASRVMDGYPGAHAYAYLAGTERGAADLMGDLGDFRLEVLNANADKFLRSQATAAAWNAGKILLPRHAPWLEDFLNELRAFTGVRDVYDDQVDALAGAFDGLSSTGDSEATIVRVRPTR